MQEVQECTPTVKPVCNTVYQTICTDSAGYNVPSAGYSGKIKRDDSESVRLSGKIKEESATSDRIKRDNVPFTAFSAVGTGQQDEFTAPPSSTSALYSVPEAAYKPPTCQQVHFST